MADGENSTPSLAWDTNASLRLRILRAQAEVATLTLDSTVKGTTKDNKSFSYQGITAAQVVARAKSALIAQGVLYTPIVDRQSFRQDGNKTSLWISGLFENVDSPEDFMERGAWGAGTDNSDNGYAKAFTNANKQILTKTLNMTTIEDEKTVEVEHEAERAPAAVREAQALTEAAIRQWADSFREALRGAKTLKDLKRIRAENGDMLKRVPEATSEYFMDMIAGLEGTLE